MEKHLEGERCADLTSLDITRAWLERLRIVCQHQEVFFLSVYSLLIQRDGSPLLSKLSFSFLSTPS